MCFVQNDVTNTQEKQPTKWKKVERKLDLFQNYNVLHVKSIVYTHILHFVINNQRHLPNATQILIKHFHLTLSNMEYSSRPSFCFIIFGVLVVATLIIIFFLLPLLVFFSIVSSLNPENENFDVINVCWALFSVRNVATRPSKRSGL